MIEGTAQEKDAQEAVRAAKGQETEESETAREQEAEEGKAVRK